jgi:hypothetical protein
MRMGMAAGFGWPHERGDTVVEKMFKLFAQPVF